tara:strand:+ start:87 stop:1490 length:1404 start_codon:yes stop_codon:yes gene_type:complete
MSKDKELTTAEIRKLIRAHNVLMSIKIPPQTSREGILKILDDKGYMVNHIRKSIQRRYKNERKPNVTLKQADTILKKPEKTQSQIKMDVEKKKAKIEKQRVEKAKEIKLAKKEGVKEFKAGQKKGFKDNFSNKGIEKMKAKQPLTNNTKKALKKEDEVRPKEKVGKVKFDPKNVKVVGVKQKPITIGAKPKGGRIETGTLNKGKIVSGAEKKEVSKSESAWKEYKELLDKNKQSLTDYDYWKNKYTPSQINGQLWLNKLKKELSVEKVGGGAVKKVDFKIGDTYLFKIKTKEFEGIAIRVNDKSVTMLLKWVNGNIIDKAIKKEDIIKRLGGTNYDEDLGETYTMSIEKKKVGGGAVKKEDKKSPFTDDEVKLINDLLHGAAQYKGGKTESGNPPKSIFKLFQDKNPISAKGTQKTNFKSALKLFLDEQNPSETDDEAIEGLDGTDRTFTKQMDKLGERLLKMRNWV